MAAIHVQHLSDSQYRVEVDEGSSRTTHAVTASLDVIQKYGKGVSPEVLIEKSFEFLLEREPKESILSTFELSIIEHYFPEYPQKIRTRLV